MMTVLSLLCETMLQMVEAVQHCAFEYQYTAVVHRVFGMRCLIPVLPIQVLLVHVLHAGPRHRPLQE